MNAPKKHSGLRRPKPRALIRNNVMNTPGKYTNSRHISHHLKRAASTIDEKVRPSAHPGMLMHYKQLYERSIFNPDMPPEMKEESIQHYETRADWLCQIFGYR